MSNISRFTLVMPLAVGALAACISRSPASDQPQGSAAAAQRSSLEGAWELVAVPPPRQPSSFQIGIAVDSVKETDVHGRLTQFFTGDVGIDPSRFSDFAGSVTDDSLVSLTLSTTETPPASFSIGGRLRGDTIHVATFVLGPDTLSARGREWLLVRKP